MRDDKKFLERLFLKHATSAALSMLGVQACLMINSILAGKFFSANGLAVMSVAAPIFSIYSAIGALSCIGGSIVAAQSLGRDDQSAANRTFFCAFVLCGGLAIVFSLLGLAFQRELLTLFGCSDQILSSALEYTTIYLAGGACISLYYMPYHFLKLMGRLTTLTILFLGMAAANCALDIFFCRKLSMGIEGIALGTVLSALLTVLIGTIVLRKDFRAERGNEFRSIVKVGTPSMLNNALTFLRSTMMNNLLVTTAGSAGLVIFSVVTAIENLSIVILVGISQATSAFIGMFFVERDNFGIRRIENMANTISLSLIFLMIAAVWFFSNQIGTGFGIVEPFERKPIIDGIRIFSLSLIPSSACVILSSYYQATKYLELANAINILRGFVLLMLPAYLLAPHFGLEGIWWSFSIAAWGTQFIAAIMIFRKRDEDRSGVLLLDERADRNGASIAFSVENKVEAISERVKTIVEFCEHNRLNPKETMLIRLSMEEMMISLAEHCFAPDVRASMDVRVFVDPETIILRIRNGGRIFNPIDYYERMEQNDPLEFAMSDALGISMISKAASSVRYKSALGINNLTVTIERKAETT